MSLWDDLGNFGSGMLDSVGEGFGNLVSAATTPTQSVNPNTQRQDLSQADDYGNKVTPQLEKQDNTLLYVGGGVAVVLVLGMFAVVASK